MITKYRTTWFTFFIGGIAWLFAAYWLLYNSGAVETWVGFVEAPQPSLDGWPVIVLLCSTSGAILMSRRLASLTLDDRGVTRKWFKTCTVAWNEVDKVVLHEKTRMLVIISGNKRIEAWWDYQKFGELSRQVMEMVRSHSPKALVDHRR